jgi:uncharacterized RDD family membrane protein YckC
MNRAGFGIRLGALLIDGIILFILYKIVGVVVAPHIDPTNKTFQEVWEAAIAAARRTMIFYSFVQLAYMSTEVFQAASPGKMILKLKIIGENGEAATPDRLWKRFAIKNAATVVGLLWAITGLGIVYALQMLVGLAIFGGCFMALSAKKQALHDVLAQTAVLQPGAVGVSPQGFEPVIPTATPANPAPAPTATRA